MESGKKGGISNLFWIIFLILAIILLNAKAFLFALSAFISTLILSPIFNNFIKSTFKTEINFKTRFFVVIILLIIGLLSLSPQTEEPTITKINKTIIKEVHYKINEKFGLGKNIYIINSIKKQEIIGQSASGRLQGDLANGIFYIISVKVDGNETHLISLIADNKTYYEDNEARLFLENPLDIGINNGGTLIFDISKEAKDVKLKISTIEETAFVNLV